MRGRKYFRDLLRDSVCLPAQSQAQALWLQHRVKRLKMLEKDWGGGAAVLTLHLWLNASCAFTKKSLRSYRVSAVKTIEGLKDNTFFKGFLGYWKIKGF